MSIDLLKKNVESVINLKKLDNVKAAVKFAIDISGSMQPLFNDGTVQKTFDRITVKEHMYGSYVNKFILNNRSINLWGGTDYAPVMKLIVESEFSSTGLFSMFSSNKNSKFPVYAIVLTDGQNSDQSAVTSLIEKYSDKNIYWEFVGIGNENFRFLQTIGDKYSNVGFVNIKDINKISDENLYKELLNDEFCNWIKKF